MPGISASALRLRWRASASRSRRTGFRALSPCWTISTRNSQRTLYLLIARTALVRGKVEMTDVAAERLLALTEEGSSDRERARLYRAAGRVVTAAHTEALLDLQKIEVARLPERDVELLTAALKLGRSVRKPLPEASAPPEPSGAKRA